MKKNCALYIFFVVKKKRKFYTVAKRGHSQEGAHVAFAVGRLTRVNPVGTKRFVLLVFTFIFIFFF